MTPTIDDIDATSPRSKLYEKVRELWGIVSQRQDERLAALQKKEEDVRRRYAGKQENLVAITATSTEKEWGEVVDFLEIWEEEMPTALWRVYDGARIALGRVPTADPPTPPAGEEQTKKKGGKGGS